MNVFVFNFLKTRMDKHVKIQNLQSDAMFVYYILN